MDELPEIFRTVLVMRELEQMTYQEIAETLEISIGTVESRLFRARARFKNKILQLHPEFAGESGEDDPDGARARGKSRGKKS